MKTRLTVFAAALLLLPLCGLLLGGGEWADLPHHAIAPAASPAALLLTAMLLASYYLLVNQLVGRLTGTRPFQLQRDYFLWVGAASAALGWLLAYLNLYVASWGTQSGDPYMLILLCTPLFALLAPAVLVTRSLLGAFGGPLRRLSRIAPLPALRADTAAFFLLPLTALGLLGGPIWPEALDWLLWLSPLLLLAALQLLWGEGTVFGALLSGNWARLVFAALGGIAVGNIAVSSYQLFGGTLAIVPAPLFVQAGYAAFGLLCLQLGDVIAESWRGKQRPNPNRKKPFPIPVVARTPPTR